MDKDPLRKIACEVESKRLLDMVAAAAVSFKKEAVDRGINLSWFYFDLIKHIGARMVAENVAEYTNSLSAFRAYKLVNEEIIPRIATFTQDMDERRFLFTNLFYAVTHLFSDECRTAVSADFEKLVYGC